MALWKRGIADLSLVYAAGEATPVDTINELRDRIGRIDPKLNAYVRLSPDLDEQAAASAARWKDGRPLSPLDGVPVAVKDNLAVAGMPAAWGSAVFAETVCTEDELPVRRLRDAGALLVGKTNTPEFAVEGYTGNRLFGVTGNPWNPELTPGGSSGGSVAAVAAGLAAAAIGTDGGGSIRRPAGHTGLYGLKPTIGAVARGGGLPQLLLDFEVAGPLARSAADASILYAALRGPDRLDPTSRFTPDRATPPDRKLRILYAERIDGNPLDPQIAASVGAAAGGLAGLGHEIVRGDLPFDLSAINAFWPKFGQIGLAHLRAVTPDFDTNASPKYADMAWQGGEVPAHELFGALEAIRDLRVRVSAAFGGWDLIMTPSAAAQPWPAGEGFPPVIDGHEVGPRGHAVYTGWVNASGHPAINIPAAPDSAGMPVGFQLIGDLFTEPLLLSVAEAFEATGPGWIWPAIARE
jgi:Asp-tRNA(Asn)/Glu-tRNA(Gln) amidotransferase A subunit family amidase